MRHHTQRGFTLVEMIVAVGLFAVVSLVCIGTVLALINANRKAQALQSVMNNLNVAVDGMARAAREGSVYHCGGGTVSVAQSCPAGGTTFAFESFGGDTKNAGDQWVYQFVAPAGGESGYIRRSKDSGTTWVRITAPEVSITSMNFYVAGTNTLTQNGDVVQPQVLMMIIGTAGTDSKSMSTFHLQVSATQRVLDV